MKQSKYAEKSPKQKQWQRTPLLMTATFSVLMTYWIEVVESSLLVWMVLLVWPKFLAVAVHQTICRGETRMKTCRIMPVASCATLMPSAILAVDASGRRTDSLARMSIIL